MNNAHARLSPSNHRWPNCPGSVREEAEYEDVSGEAAIDGTGSHLLLELCMENNVKAASYDMQIIGANHHDKPNGWLVDAERCERVQMCLDYIERRVNELRKQFPGCKVRVESESKADPGGMFGRDDWWGTSDVTIFVVNDHEKCLFMEAVDYKDGRGYVKAEGNTQLYSYLVGKMRPYICSGPDLVRPFYPENIQGCRMTIVQPKTNPAVRYDEPTVADALETVIDMSRSANATDDPNAPLIPDDKGGKGYCRWCKHKSNCNAESTRCVEEVNTMETQQVTVTGGNPVAMTPDELKNVPADQLVQVADTKAGMLAGYVRIDEEIQRRIEAGETVNGYAMQPGRGSRVWNEDEEKIVKALKGRRLKLKEIYPQKLISPAAALKLDSLDEDQKKRLEKTLISFKAGKSTLTRVAYQKDDEQKDVELMFAEVGKEEEKASDLNFGDTPKTETPKTDEPVTFF